MSFFPQMSSPKDTNDLAVFCVWLESAATRRTCFASSRLQSKSQYLRECHPREPSPKKTKRKNWFRKFFFFLVLFGVPHPEIMFLSYLGFLSSPIPGGSDGKESACNSRNLGSISGLGRFPGEGKGYPLQCSCLENPMDRGAWWVTVHGVTKSWTQLSDLHFHFTSFH